MVSLDEFKEKDKLRFLKAFFPLRVKGDSLSYLYFMNFVLVFVLILALVVLDYFFENLISYDHMYILLHAILIMLISAALSFFKYQKNIERVYREFKDAMCTAILIFLTNIWAYFIYKIDIYILLSEDVSILAVLLYAYFAALISMTITRLFLISRHVLS